MDIDLPSIFKKIEENNLYHGIFFLSYLIGSKFVFRSIPKPIKSIFDYLLVRVYIIFSAAFISTKNVRNALILACGYVLIFEYIFNPKSSLCLFGCESEKKKQYPIDIGINNQTVIQQQQPAPQQQQIQTQLPPLQMDMNPSPSLNPGPMAFGVENFSNYY